MKNIIKVLFSLFSITMLFGCLAMNGSARFKANEYFEDKGAIDLAEAAAIGDIKTLEALKAAGVNVNHVGRDGMTPLHWAVMARNNAGVKRLLELGASPNISSLSGRSIVRMVVGMGNHELLKLILDHRGNPNHIDHDNSIMPTPLFLAVGNMDVDSVSLLAGSGADLNFRRMAGSETPIMAAAALNQWEMVYIMLLAGADYAVKNRWGNTVVYYLENNNIAANTDLYNWRQKVVGFLFSKKVHVNPKPPKF